MTAAPSLWSFVVHADGVVKSVLFLLALASVFSWSIILQRFRLLKQEKQQMRLFEDQFWSGIDLTACYHQLETSHEPLTGLAQIFRAGFAEFCQKRNLPLGHAQRMQGVLRALRSEQTRYLEQLAGKSDWLATIGSISPYVGLFGTVWGIMTSFRSLGLVQQASISMVAPGIAEALIATAAGLLAAIPAVVAYNRLSARLDALAASCDNFSDELLNILQRQNVEPGESA